VVSGPPPLRFGAALAVLRILDLGRDEGFAESGFNLFKEPKISFGDTLILLVASPSVTRLSEKSSPDNFDFVRISPELNNANKSK
jgi:hypothetical protein